MDIATRLNDLVAVTVVFNHCFVHSRRYVLEDNLSPYDRLQSFSQKAWLLCR